MRLISSNIRFDSPKDGELSWAKRRKLLAKCLNSFSPDIIGTQEGRQVQLNDLGSLLPYLKMEAKNRNWILERMYPTIFYNPKTITVVDSGDIWLSKTPSVDGSKDFDSAFPRLFTWIKGTHKGLDFFLVNVHLDHVKDHTRAHQGQVLVDQIKKLNQEKAPLIMMGDFNEGPLGEVRKIIQRGFPEIYDPWEKLGHKEEESHHKFKGKLKNALRIDWILCEKTITCDQIALDKTSEGFLYPSDHFPLQATLLISKS